MYAVAVCDDEEPVLRHIARSISLEFERRGQPTVVDEYSGATALEKRFQLANSYDVLLIDIDMPKLDGIEFCRRFREQGGDSLIVFVSNREELVFKTFEVAPFRFVRKSRLRKEIGKLCDDIIIELERRADKFLCFNDEQGSRMYSVNIRKLMYVEASRKYCKLCSVGDTLEIQIQFNEMMAKLGAMGFIQIHRSYLVNPAFIYLIDNDSVTLDDGERLPMSRNRRNDVKDSFFHWRRAGL